MRAIRPISFLSLALLAACSSLIGADFDGLGQQGPTNGGRAGASGASGAAGMGGAGADLGSGGVAGLSQAGGGIGGVGGTAGAAMAGSGGASGSTGGGEAGTGEAGAAGAAGSAGAGGAGGEGGGCNLGPDPSTIDDAAAVRINEIHGQGGGDDYVELYNLGPGTRDLSGHSIADGKGNDFVFPAGTLLGEGEFLVMMLPETVPNGNHGPFPCFMPCMVCFHESGWGISAGGEDVELRDEEDDLLDATSYPDEDGSDGLENGQNWGRVPDGTGAFRATAETPGLPNRAP